MQSIISVGSDPVPPMEDMLHKYGEHILVLKKIRGDTVVETGTTRVLSSDTFRKFAFETEYIKLKSRLPKRTIIPPYDALGLESENDEVLIVDIRSSTLYGMYSEFYELYFPISSYLRSLPKLRATM